MRTFTYSLETLLRYREGIEERERDELHRLTYNHQVEDNIRKGVAAKLLETMHNMVALCANKSTDQELAWFHLYLKRLTREMCESDKRLAQLKSAIEAQKQAVIKASKNRKTLASMKEKKEKEFFEELGRREQKEIDDLVVTRHPKAEPEEQNSAEIRILEGAVKRERSA